MQFPSTFYTPDALGYMSHSLNRSHTWLAYFQPMASCLADGFLSIKINMQNKIFFDVFFTFFSYFFVRAGRAESIQENTNACGHSENAPTGIKIRFQYSRFALVPGCIHAFSRFFSVLFFSFLFSNYIPQYKR